MTSIDKSIEKIMNFGKNEFFYANGRFKCSFWKWQATGEEAFTGWKKDNNSPSVFTEAKLNIIDEENGHNHMLGLIQIQQDKSLNDGYFATLFTKPHDANEWKHMYTITSLIA